MFPSAADPTAGPYNRQQVAALARRCEVEVLGTIPWFPGAGLLTNWSTAGRLVGVPRREIISGLVVHHPRFLYVPKLGDRIAAGLYERCLWSWVRRYRGAVDVLLGAWAYPDGVAVINLGRRLGVPVVVKVHGSDLDVVGQRPAVAAQLRVVLPRAEFVVAESRPLGSALLSLGVPRERVAVVPHGVDREIFFVRERGRARLALEVPLGGALVLFVGRLERNKGLLELLEAFGRLASRTDGVRLALLGDGSERAACEAFRRRFPGRVLILGERSLQEVALWMAACDLLALPSWGGGTPNVLLEALASGRPVAACAVGEIPDLLRTSALGLMSLPHEPTGLAANLARLLADRADAESIARSSGVCDWDASASLLHDVLARAVALYWSSGGRRLR